MFDYIKKEPAMVMAAIQSGLALGVSFGLKLSVEQAGAIMAFSAAVLGLITRQLVSPAAK